MRTRDRKGALTEAAFQAQVVDLAHLYGWVTAHFHDSRRQVSNGQLVGDVDAAGFPDIVAVRRDRLLFAELKSSTGRLSDAQKGWLASLEGTCAEVHVWRPEDWPVVERALR